MHTTLQLHNASQRQIDPIPEDMMDTVAKLWQTVQRERGEMTRLAQDAEFVGWQETMKGDVLALYVVKARHHPLYRSTVSERTLRAEHLEIPPTPLPQRQSKRLDHEK